MARLPLSLWKHLPTPLREALDLLQHVLAHSDDDTPRLRYADWLQGHGGEAGADRAEFIRLQCELARLPEDDPRRPSLQQREAALLDRYRRAWDRDVGGLGDERTYRRGFVEAVRFRDNRDFLTAANDLFAVAPVRHLSLCWLWRPGGAVLALSPHLARLTALGLRSCYIDVPALRLLLTSPYLAGLRTLDLSGMRLNGRAAARVVARSANLAGLTALDLRGCRIGSRALAALARAPHLAGLRTLRLGGFDPDDTNDVGLRGLRALAASPYLKNLTHLDLDTNELAAGSNRPPVLGPVGTCCPTPESGKAHP
jgi:uncharacterized protein (TIGR02996 family)